MFKHVFKIEMPHGRQGQGFEDVLSGREIETYCPRARGLMRDDTHAQDFLSERHEKAAEFSVFNKGLGGYFKRGADPDFQRANVDNWETGFASREQMQAIFEKPEVFKLMKNRGLELHEFQMRDCDVHETPHQAFYYSPEAVLFQRYDLDTGEQIHTPIKPDLEARIFRAKVVLATRLGL